MSTFSAHAIDAAEAATGLMWATVTALHADDREQALRLLAEWDRGTAFTAAMTVRGLLRTLSQMTGAPVDDLVQGLAVAGMQTAQRLRDGHQPGGTP